MPEVEVLVIGDGERADFCEFDRPLADSALLTRFSNVESAAVWLQRDARSVRLIVLLQSWPGEFSHASVDQLRRLAPLARIVGLLGSWCEGESRTGTPWPGGLRTYWHQWPARCRLQLREMAEGRAGAWGLPVTASEEERMLAMASIPQERRGGLIVIHAAHAASREALSDACRARGYSVAAVQPGHKLRISGAAALLWETTAESAADVRRIRVLKAQCAGDVPIIALVSFPRREFVDRAKGAGVAAVVSKPFLLEDLFWQLDEATAPG